MLAVVPRTVYHLVAVFLICMATWAVFACQVHTAAPDHGHRHGMPGESHHSSPAHALPDFACMGMTAVLSAMVMFAVLLFQGVYTAPLLVQHTLFVFPPFIPPRQTIR
jgi:hypothetical protein